MTPYLAILVAFGLFVVWNGGVVLGSSQLSTFVRLNSLTLIGDKLNHIASLHLPQMLYIWPCMVFFSWPVLLPTAARMSWSRLPRLVVATPVTLVMTAVVHFNTIIHPFTLADNRHFVFYMFRILLRHPLIKYAVVPIYFVSAWLVIKTLQHMPRVKKTEKRDGIKISPPKARIGFVLVWLATTTLSLITAPLVEPRYFIIPWLIWRMNLHLETDFQEVGNGNHNQEGGVASLMRHPVWLAASHCLWVETIWYSLINLVTCYVFLYRGFEWAQEPGMTQRFMW
jgi:alpha-1,2-glucosyltransferase